MFPLKSHLRDPREIFPPLTSLLNTPEFLLLMVELEKEEKEEEEAENPLSPLLNIELEECLARLVSTVES